VDHSDERQRIEIEIDKLLQRPVSEYRPTTLELAHRLGLQRWVLTQRHSELNRSFQVAIRKKWGTEGRGSQLAHLGVKGGEADLAKARARIVELEELVSVYASVIEELRLQNTAIRAGRAGNVIHISSHPRTLDT
jgi:hypothetical protein